MGVGIGKKINRNRLRGLPQEYRLTRSSGNVRTEIYVKNDQGFDTSRESAAGQYKN